MNINSRPCLNSIRISLLIILFLCLSSVLFAQKTVHVREYKRKDGTIVRAHDRRAPGSTSASTGSATMDTDVDDETVFTSVPQEIAGIKNWKSIKEMSGEIPGYPGLTAEVFASEIARGEDVIKLLMRFEYPWGSPGEVFKAYVPHGFDPTSIKTVLIRFEFDCRTSAVKVPNGSAEVWQFNGKHHTSKEVPFTLASGHVFFQYFCEEGKTPAVAPKLRP